MTEVVVLQALFLYLPYLLALLLAFRAKSPAARRLVAGAAVFMLVALVVVAVLTWGCSTNDFRFTNCPRVGPNVAGALSVASVWLLAAHFVVMPVLAVAAVVMDLLARRAQRRQVSAGDRSLPPATSATAISPSTPRPSPRRQ